MEIYLVVTDDYNTYYSWCRSDKGVHNSIKVSEIEDIIDLSCKTKTYKVIYIDGYRNTNLYNLPEGQKILNQLAEGTYNTHICKSCEYFQKLPAQGNESIVDTCMAGKELYCDSCTEYEVINEERRNKAKQETQSKVTVSRLLPELSNIFPRQVFGILCNNSAEVDEYRAFRRNVYNNIQQQMSPEQNYHESINSIQHIELFLNDYVHRRQPCLVNLDIEPIITKIIHTLNREIDRIHSINGYRPTHLVVDAKSYLFIELWMKRLYYTIQMSTGERTRELRQMLGLEIIRSVPENDRAFFKILTIPES